ncbi:hypothetical protein B7C51_19345 [Paenibacillus larvae subsp. pulvifaciens]|uniref:Uncharacterized protein n=1 Tax=Paenibacillus larvae subsp. pulvifaciens TaxID=1477 RepID=A0A1V0UWB9_9BACL|nr:DUF6731 family protein [Paenibacillus larvae]ARF69513.1 hypothetical protein B7C51_19345 [Paenibacillus larvae subsp. pulvifaciens]
MAGKYVRFNYFEVLLVPAAIHVRAELEEDFEINAAATWRMERFLDYLAANHDKFNTNVNVGNEFSEVEKDSIFYDERRGLHHFQLSKLRETNIPSKKRFGEIKEDILLNQDEYIGEFNSIIYDNKYGALIMQSNFYGLTVKQTEQVLTELRFRYLDEIGENEDDPLIVKLAPIIDKSKIDRVMKADYYKKIRIKGSDVMLDANLGENNLLCEARDMLYEISGVNIDISISLGRAEKTASLNDQVVRDALRQFSNVEDETRRPQVEITALYNEEAETETINLVEPRMTDRIIVDVEPRQTVGHEYLYQQFVVTYDERRSDVRRVMVPL